MPTSSPASPLPAASSASSLAASPPLERMARRVLRRSFEGQNWARVRTGGDALVLYVACGFAVFGYRSVQRASLGAWLAMGFPLLVMAMMHARQTPDSRLNGSVLDTAVHVLGVVSLATVLLLALTSLFDTHPVGLALRVWLFTAVYLTVSRCTLLWVRRSAMRSGLYAVPTLIVGAGTVGTHLVRRLADDPGYGLRPLGLLDANPLAIARDDHALTVPVLGGLDDLEEAIVHTGARRVIMAFSNERDYVLVQKARECQRLGIDVSLVPRMFESINDRATLDHVGGLPLVTLHAVDPRGWQFAIKHALDRGVAAVGLILLSPVMVVLALAVRLSSPGPVLFRQRRVGRDGHEFDVLKFRTMRMLRAGAAGFEVARGMAPGGVEGVDRRTFIGRWMRDLSLDELPQLINVLKGDMSLVGPRPERPEYVELFVRDVERYGDRHRVKSGITGWAQVHGLRGQTSIADRVEWDNYYIQNWTLRLDLKILALTLVEVLRLRDRRTGH